MTLLAASSAGSTALAKNSYNKMTLNVMGQSEIVSIQPNTLTIDEHGIYHTVLVDHSTLMLYNKPPINASQRFPVEEDPSMDLDGNRQNNQTEPTKYTVRHDHETLELAGHLLLVFMYCY